MKSQPREFEVWYWFGVHTAKPNSKGYPKTELGTKKSNGAGGAIRFITNGLCSKVQVRNRLTGKVLWTAYRERVPGVHVYSARIVKGDQ